MASAGDPMNSLLALPRLIEVLLPFAGLFCLYEKTTGKGFSMGRHLRGTAHRRAACGGMDNDLVVKVLGPIWGGRTETSTRLRGRIESILDWAPVSKYRQGENPPGGQPQQDCASEKSPCLAVA